MKASILLLISLVVNFFAIADTTTVYQLPFEETFYTGDFTTNEWTVEGGNWQITGQEGNPLPSAEFVYYPMDTAYSYSLTSAPINGADFTAGHIMLEYDLRLDDQNATGQENLSAEVFDGTEWITVAIDSSTGDFSWKRKKIDISIPAKGKIFQIRFRAHGNNTLDINKWQIDNISVYRFCKKPQELTANFYNPVVSNKIILEWQHPEYTFFEEGWLSWDDGTNAEAIGLQGGGTFQVASRFTPVQLNQYAGGYLTEIRFFPYSPNGTIVLKVWTGPNANTLVTSQPVTSYNSGVWNNFELDNPVLVTGNEELWFGYEVTHGVQYVAGCDGGPAITGYGDMVSFDGIVWESMSTAYNLDYNWNLQGYIEDGPIIFDSTNIVAGYNVYYFDEWLAYTTEMFYIDEDPGRDLYCYRVTAVYEDCESGLSNEACEWVGLNDLNASKIRIYPNPSTGYANLEFTGSINRIIVYDLLGDEIHQVDISPAQMNYQLNTFNYPNGVYLIKFLTKSGESIIRKLVVYN